MSDSSDHKSEESVALDSGSSQDWTGNGSGPGTTAVPSVSGGGGTTTVSSASVSASSSADRHILRQRRRKHNSDSRGKDPTFVMTDCKLTETSESEVDRGGGTSTTTRMTTDDRSSSRMVTDHRHSVLRGRKRRRHSRLNDSALVADTVADDSTEAHHHSSDTSGSQSWIQEVWADNLAKEISVIESLIDSYPFVAMDTEFPGVVARPINVFDRYLAYSYCTLSRNVNMLKLIQLGLTFYNEKGERPPGVSTWQFNFHFELKHDMYAPDSIQLLVDSGLQLKLFASRGIRHSRFAEMVTMSGLVLNDDIRWICFHGSYDFAYLIHTLTDHDLPERPDEYFWILKTFFPHICDLKIIFRNKKNMRGGLQSLANACNVSRNGQQHQAGSDSLLTGDLYFTVREELWTKYGGRVLSKDDYMETEIYGIGGPQTGPLAVPGPGGSSNRLIYPPPTVSRRTASSATTAASSSSSATISSATKHRSSKRKSSSDAASRSMSDASSATHGSSSRRWTNPSYSQSYSSLRS